jgi:hypothetical protein
MGERTPEKGGGSVLICPACFTCLTTHTAHEIGGHPCWDQGIDPVWYVPAPDPAQSQVRKGKGC